MGTFSMKVDSHQNDSSNTRRFYDVGLPPPQPFFGRSKELVILDKTYKNSRTRVAVISGQLGGEGKSQLAMQWLRAQFAARERPASFCLLIQ
jgi:hypothetical protein